MKFWLRLILACAFLFGGTGAAFGADPFILDGIVVSVGSFDSVVGLTYNGERFPRCTGTLIAANVVLSAGHCICEALDGGFHINAVYTGTDPDNVVGRSKGYYFPVVHWWTRYDCSDPARRNGVDLAIIQLDRKVIGLAPVPLASAEVLLKINSGKIVGYGATDASGEVMDHRKRMADIQVIDRSCSVKNDQRKYGCVSGAELVAGRPNTPDTCSGDSGGPLLSTKDGNSFVSIDSQLYLVAVTSRSVLNATKLCGDGAVYELLGSSSKNWIWSIEHTIVSGQP